MIQVVEQSAGIHETGATFAQQTFAFTNGGTADVHFVHDDAGQTLTMQVAIRDSLGSRAHHEVVIPAFR